MQLYDIDVRVLDGILAWQIVIAWAGEKGVEPEKLNWWDSSLADPIAGADFFRRLVPRTSAWTAMEAAVDAARAVDKVRRRKAGNPDRLRTLFFLGYDVDRALTKRLYEHKMAGTPPSQALPLPVPLDDDAFAPEAVAEACRKAWASTAYEHTQVGREMQGRPPADPLRLVERLVGTLAPFEPDYPCPYYLLKQ